jgi:hypothetical protein
MKTYEQWSSRAKQAGWAEDQYSQAAYQGYVNDFNKPKPKPKPKGGSNPAPRPLPVAQPPLQTNQFSEVESQITALTAQMQQQANDYDAQIAKTAAEQKAKEAKKPQDASRALNSTLLTGTAGISQKDKKKKKQNFLQPIGG